MLSKIMRFLKSLVFHIGCGMPKSTQKEVDKRWFICVDCDFFETDNTDSKCLQCGCHLSRQKKFLNKLAWKDQKCPVGKW